jgi:prolyl oligopeptidase
MHRARLRVFLFAATVALIGAGALPPQPTPPPPGDVLDTYFGVKVPDPYRAFEDPKNPALLDYFKAQNAYTRSVLDALPGRAARPCTR